jgi:hypothetical protein
MEEFSLIFFGLENLTKNQNENQIIEFIEKFKT